jgi:phenylacetate-coenzyme A ligase PaaK-like adenylate-forming protein
MPAREMKRRAWTGKQMKAQQQRKLRRLLAHAIEHSTFHSHRLAGIDPERFELGDLWALPVMTKAEMMAAFDEVVTDRRLTLRAVNTHLAKRSEHLELLANQYLCLASGGSSGMRGVFVYDRLATAALASATLAPHLGRMLGAGGPPTGGFVVGMVVAASAGHPSAAMGALLDGRFARVVRAPVTLPLREIVGRLNAGQPHLLICYPSMLRLLSGERSAGRLTITPRSIIATGEQLTHDVAETAEAVFEAAVLNVFGCAEGLVGSSARGGETITFATDLVFVELVDEASRPVPPGAASAKALITNLYNFVQPLIRYELLDSFIRTPDAPGDGHLRAIVVGRADNAFVYGDVTVAPSVIRSRLVETPAVNEYQVRQTPSGVDVSVVASRAFDGRALAAEVARALSNEGLPNPEVSIRTVDHIERHAETGKVRCFIPLAGLAGALDPGNNNDLRT